MTSIAEASAKIAEARRELKNFAQTKGPEAIGSAFKTLFDKYPDIDHIQWTQYTPHFNDGDVCQFRVNQPEAYDINDNEFDDWDKIGEDAYSDFDDIWSDCDEELLELCFGDGVKVTITADGVEVEEYDHD